MVWLLLIWGVLIFVILLMFSIGSFCALLRSNGGQHLRGSSRPSGFLKLSSCFACGIFLSTCFLGLLPHVREHERKIAALFGGPSGQQDRQQPPLLFLKSELIVLLGFLLILFIEQLVRACSPSSSLGHCHAHGSAVAPAEGLGCKESASGSVNRTSSALVSVEGDDEPLVMNRFDSDDSDDDDSNVTPKIEFRRIEDEVASLHAQNRNGAAQSAVVCGTRGLSLNSTFLLIGLCTHSLFEGVALGIQNSSAEFYRLLLGIMLHEVLCSFAFGVNLAQQRTPIGAACLSAAFLACCIPLGMCSSILVSSLDSSSALVCRFVLEGLAAGTFVYVACVDMLSVELRTPGDSPSSGVYSAIAVVVGVFVFFVVKSVSGASYSTHSADLQATTLSPNFSSNIRTLL